MKKLLILMLVLGLASTASATLSFSPSGVQLNTPAGAFSVDVVSTDNAMYTWYVALTGSTYGSITEVTVMGGAPDPDGAPAGNDATAVLLGDLAGFYSVYMIEALDMSEPFDSVQPGTQFVVNLNFTSVTPADTLQLVLLDPATTVMDSTTLSGIPEPMTIALLGLGGLFLLRRRK